MAELHFDEIISEENLKHLNVDMFRDYDFGGMPSDGIEAPEKQQNVAFFARAMREHVGWEAFPDSAKEAFKTEIEKIYADTTPTSQEELRQKLNRIIRLLPDRHASLWAKTVYTGFSKKASFEKPPVYAGENVLCRDDLTWLAKGTDPWGNGVWGIAEKEGALVVSVARCHIPDAHLASAWADFKQAFDKAYDNGRKYHKMILDVRGNPGGEDWPLDYIARKTYGNDLNAIRTVEIRDTKLAMHFLSKHGMFKGSDQKLDPDGMAFSGKKEVLMDEQAKYFDFNPDKGFNGQIDILLDQHVGSAAESAHNLFFHHPHARFIGQHTKGMQQYQQGNIIMPCGVLLRVGVLQRNYYDQKGMIECSGHDVDIDTCSNNDSGVRDAFEVALYNPDMSGPLKRQEYLSGLSVGQHISETANYMSCEQKSFNASYVLTAIQDLHHRNQSHRANFKTILSASSTAVSVPQSESSKTVLPRAIRNPGR